MFPKIFKISNIYFERHKMHKRKIMRLQVQLSGRLWLSSQLFFLLLLLVAGGRLPPLLLLLLLVATRRGH